tara:strand:+ start:443 stop:649 length:207 start_codon:yes stop_codon:yes gene_type:complete
MKKNNEELIEIMNKELYNTANELETSYNISTKEDVEIDSSEHVAYLVGYMEALEYIIDIVNTKWSIKA